MVICPQCGAENNEALQSCRMCLSPLAGDITGRLARQQMEPEFVETIIATSSQHPQVTCGRCGSSNASGYKFCQQCGAKLSSGQLGVRPPAEIPRDANLSPAPTPETPTVSPAPTPHLPRREAAADQYKTTPASGAMLQCSNCANEVLLGSLFCNLCGTRLSVDQTVAMPTPKPPPQFRIRVIVDGEESDEIYELGQETVIGRVKGDINFPYDDYMSSRHASIRRQGERFILKDEGSRNGTLIVITGEVELKPGDVFMIGKQLFKFEMNE